MAHPHNPNYIVGAAQLILDLLREILAAIKELKQ